MDRVEFVIAKDWLDDAFFQECVEPVLNGLSLVDIVKRAEQRPVVWAGLPPNELFDPLGQALTYSRAIGDRVTVLRCICGHRSCSEVTTELRVTRGTVTWHQFKVPGSRDDTYGTIGPYEFARDAFEQALSNPTRSDSPVRDKTVLEGLSRGEPNDPREWLRLAYTEAEWPAANEHLPRLIGGLQALSRAGKAIPEPDAYLWARDMGWNEHTCATIVGLIRAANAIDTDPHR